MNKKFIIKVFYNNGEFVYIVEKTIYDHNWDFRPDYNFITPLEKLLINKLVIDNYFHWRIKNSNPSVKNHEIRKV